MPRYFFDVQTGGLSEQDDDGVDAAHLDDDIALARDMLIVALADAQRLHLDRHAVIMVRNRVGQQVAERSLEIVRWGHAAAGYDHLGRA